MLVETFLNPSPPFSHSWTFYLLSMTPFFGPWSLSSTLSVFFSCFLSPPLPIIPVTSLIFGPCFLSCPVISSPHFLLSTLLSLSLLHSSPLYSPPLLLFQNWTEDKATQSYSLLIPGCDPLVTGASREQGIVGHVMAEQLWWGQGSAALTTACCRGRGGGAAVARAAAGHLVLLMEHGGGKAGGREKAGGRHKEQKWTKKGLKSKRGWEKEGKIKLYSKSGKSKKKKWTLHYFLVCRKWTFCDLVATLLF